MAARAGVLQQAGKPRQQRRPMPKDLQTRFFAVFLALVSVAAVVFACINFQKSSEFPTPTDGIWWVEDGSHLRPSGLTRTVQVRRQE